MLDQMLLSRNPQGNNQRANLNRTAMEYLKCPEPKTEIKVPKTDKARSNTQLKYYDEKNSSFRMNLLYNRLQNDISQTKTRDN